MRVFVASGVVTGVLICAPALAHHSFAPHFDSSKPVSISGVITEFEGRNPHSYVHIQAVDENGRTQEYVCESHGVTQLTRNGVTPQVMKAGTRIRVTGSLSRHSPYMCFFDSVELADGRVLSVNGPRGAGPSTAPAVAPRKDIFGTWLLAPVANRSTSGPQPMIQLMTPAGDLMLAENYNKLFTLHGVMMIFFFLIPLVNIVFGVLMNVELAKSFGQGVGFALGLLFLGFIFFPNPRLRRGALLGACGGAARGTNS